MCKHENNMLTFANLFWAPLKFVICDVSKSKLVYGIDLSEQQMYTCYINNFQTTNNIQCLNDWPIFLIENKTKVISTLA